MKQSEILDLVLRELYKYKNDGKYYSIKSICQFLGIELESNIAVRNIGKRLEKDGYINALFEPIDVHAEINSYGIEYCEEDSYTSEGQSLISNSYNLSIVNSPNSQIISQSKNVAITNEFEVAKNAVKKIRETVNNDDALDQKKLNEILECLDEIQDGIENKKKPKFAIRSLVSLAGDMSSVSSWILRLSDFAKYLPA